jgi:hypothetical protein
MRGTVRGRRSSNLVLSGCRIPVVAGLLLFAGTSAAQSLQQRGYLELSFTGFPQTAPGDSGCAIGEGLLRYEPALKVGSSLVLQGAVLARSDTHRQVERKFDISYWDRSIQRPDVDVRQLSARYFRGPLTLEVGKQIIRWGRTDILNPTDRFAPRDYLALVDGDYLGVTAACLTLARGAEALDIIYTPRFTPSRIPLFNQRWTVLPPPLSGIPLESADVKYPGGPQFGARWNHTATPVEYSFSIFQGFSHLPMINIAAQPSPPRITVFREYPKMRSYGGDVAVPLKGFLVKAEAAWSQGLAPNSDKFMLYVVQAERRYREWLFIGGYVGEYLKTGSGSLYFNPERGLAKSIMARASLTVSTTRSLIIELIGRQNAEGFYGKFEYSQAFGDHLRVTARFVLLRGSESDFIGQYRRNSFGSLATRYSF